MVSQKNEELYTLVKNFGIISNCTVAIFDTDRNIIVGYPHTTFCDSIRKCPELSKKCMECDLMGFSKCAATKKPYLYYCHMGLVEISAPIMFGDTLIGYIIIGQFTNQPDKSYIKDTLLRASKKYNFSADDALKKLEDVVFLNNDYTTALTQLIEMCASYIWMNNILNLSGSNLAHEIKLYISEHLTDNLSVPSLCKKYNTSPTALYQLFKRSFGCGVIQIIKSERIHKAQELLLDSKLTIGEIATLVGIPDANYFTRIFKKETGMTPKAFSKIIK